jgi:pimeloyl-ACP methyl ester carboxylesterase
MKERIIELPNSIKLNVALNQQDAPTLLLLHFSGGTWQMWNGVIPLFQEEYFVIAPDCRGHGKSDRPETGYHMNDMAEDIYLLLKELEIQSCHIIGSSMGAEVGLSLAASHPEMVSSLVCEGALVNEFGEHGLFEGTKEEVQLEQERLLQEFNSRILPVYPSLEKYTKEMKAQLTEYGIWTAHFLPYFESCLQSTDDGRFEHHYKNHVRTEYMQEYWDVNFEDYYKNVQCPVLFLPSEEEWENEKIQCSIKTFASHLARYEIVPLKDSIHAYVWMQSSKSAGEIAGGFLNRSFSQ